MLLPHTHLVDAFAAVLINLEVRQLHEVLRDLCARRPGTTAKPLAVAKDRSEASDLRGGELRACQQWVVRHFPKHGKRVTNCTRGGGTCTRASLARSLDAPRVRRRDDCVVLRTLRRDERDPSDHFDFRRQFSEHFLLQAAQDKGREYGLELPDDSRAAPFWRGTTASHAPWATSSCGRRIEPLTTSTQLLHYLHNQRASASAAALILGCKRHV